MKGKAAISYLFLILIATLLVSPGCDVLSPDPPPPTVNTLDATGVRYSTAQLEGSINPNGLNTSYYFEYGTTTEYGATTPETSIGTGNTDISVNALVEGLLQTTTYHFRLVGTNSRGTNYGENKTFTTLEPISIFNVSPTHKLVFTSNTSPVTITGKGNGPIGSITWGNMTTGQSGNCTGTTSWSAQVPLQEGENEVQVTASHAAASESVTITVTVTYNTSVNFTSLPQLIPDTGLVNQTYEPVYIRVGISDNGLDVDTVKLYRVDDSGNKTGGELGTLTDDGNLANGDEIEGDEIYSTRISLTSSAAGPINLKIFADSMSGIESQTGHFAFKFFTQPTTEQLNRQSGNNNSAYARFTELITSQMNARYVSKDAAAVQSLDEMVTYLKSLEGVLEAGKGSYGVWWLNETGMFCVLSSTGLDIESEEYGGMLQSEFPGNRGSDGVRANVEYNKALSAPVEYLKTGIDIDTFGLQAAAGNYNIGSSSAIHIMPFEHTIYWYTTLYPGGWYDVVVPADCPALSKTDKINQVVDPQPAGSAAVPLSVWKSLSNYGLITSATHGDTMDIPKQELEQDYPYLTWIDWLFPWHDNRVILLTNIAVGDLSGAFSTYMTDILAGRLMLFPIGNNTVSLVITPEFIDYYNGPFPNSIWINISCKGAYNNTLAAVFLAKGGGAWYGYSDYVSASYAHNTERTILDMLINQEKNAGEAFNDAVAAHGANSGGSTPAALTFYGEQKTMIGKSSLKNPSFEEPGGAGSLNGWTTSGDGRVIKKLGGDMPTDGGTMAIISTGLGFTTTTGSIYQSICLPDDAKNLVFDWNFYSEEFKEWCGSKFDDTFQVSITDSKTGVENILFYTSVNALCGNKGALIKAPISFDMGDVWYTGWKLNKNVNISAYKGKNVILKFFATDKGDSIFDTAILIDNIRITTN
jgi:hypothetical protein